MKEEELLKREVSYLTEEGKMIKVDFSSIEDLKNKYQQIDNKNIKGWYITPNPTDGKGRKQENFTKREWLIVDIDTQRPKNTNATDEELQKAFDVAGEIELQTIMGDFCSTIWQIPYIALSGNGVHLLYRCDLPNTQEANELVSKWYSLLDKAFSTTEAKIDTSMASIAQLTKLYGTWSRKAPEQENRPWRQSELRVILYDEMTWDLVLGYSSDFSKKIDINKLKEMTEDLEKIIAGKNKENNFKWLWNWCEEHGIEYRVKRTGVMFRHCPFYHEHQSEWCSGVMCDKATSVDNFVFHCFGDHCKENGRQKHTWKELRALVENGEVAQEVAQEETTNNNSSLPTPINLTDERIVAEKEYWATNISSLDQALGGGLAKGEMSVVTGFPTGGKSTFVQQMVANYVRGNLSVGYYQGDRSQEEVKNNFLTIGLSEEELAKVNFYSCLQDITPEQMVEISSLYDVFVFDSFKSYENQLNADYTLSAQLAGQFSRVVKEKKNHILTVAHQTSHNGLANTTDIASSIQIKNKADMILAVERYNDEFARKVYLELGKDSDFYSDLLVYKRMGANPSAFFSVFKNQTGGELIRIPILFEKEKKLFKNYQN
jgi:archaellum biogenesis ATPase FlaH